MTEISVARKVQRCEILVPVHKGWKYLDETVQSVLASNVTSLDRSIKLTIHILQNGEPDFDLEEYGEKLYRQEEGRYKAWQDSFGEDGWELQTPPPFWHLGGECLERANKAVALNHQLMRIERLYYDTLVFLCDADDLWESDKLASQVKFMEENPQVDVLGTRFRYISAEGGVLPNTPELPLGHDEICEVLDRNENPLANSSVCYRGELHEYGLFDPINKVEDYEFWKRLRFMGATFANLGEVLMRHRLHSESHFNGSRQQEVYKTLTDNCYQVHNTMRQVF